MQRKEFLKSAPAQDASKLKVGIVVADFNPDITCGLLEGALKTLAEWKVPHKNIKIFKVYGSFDLTIGCDRIIKKFKPDAVIAIGCIVKGETDHDVYIATAVAQGLTNLNIKYGIPVSFGVITINNLAQARIRSSGKTNHGEKAAVAALQAALL